MIARARQGEIVVFTRIDTPHAVLQLPDHRVDTAAVTVDDALEPILGMWENRGLG